MNVITVCNADITITMRITKLVNSFARYLLGFPYLTIIYVWH